MNAMLTTCDQRNNHASSDAAATPERDGLRVVSSPLLWVARTINRQPSATGREQNDERSLNDADQDQEQDFTINHPQDRHAEHQKVIDIVNSVLEMIEDDDCFL
jgi:hypothetical protein